MKRFLILFILVVFLTVSCAGPNKVGLTKRGNDFRQDEFEKDCKECIETAKKEESYSQTSGVFDYCMFKKGYEYQPQAIKGYQCQPQSKSSYVKKGTGDEKDTAETAEIVFTVLGVIAAIPLLFSMAFLLALAHK